MTTIMLTVLALSLPLSATEPQRTAQENDTEAIRSLVSRAYVDGVFRLRDSLLVKSGFHPSFLLSVRTNEGLLVVNLDAWLKRLSLDAKPSQKTFEHKFLLVDVTGNTAVVKMEIHENGKHKYTDYMGLYRFPEGWRIVNKVFEGH